MESATVLIIVGGVGGVLWACWMATLAFGFAPRTQPAGEGETDARGGSEPPGERRFFFAGGEMAPVMRIERHLRHVRQCAQRFADHPSVETLWQED